MSDADLSYPVGTPESDLEIDWAREPASDREQRIRQALLRKAVTNRAGFGPFLLRSLLNDSITGRLQPEEAASDFREAYAAAQASLAEFLSSEKKRWMDDAIREVDGDDSAQ